MPWAAGKDEEQEERRVSVCSFYQDGKKNPKKRCFTKKNRINKKAFANEELRLLIWSESEQPWLLDLSPD